MASPSTPTHTAAECADVFGAASAAPMPHARAGSRPLARGRNGSSRGQQRRSSLHLREGPRAPALCRPSRPASSSSRSTSQVPSAAPKITEDAELGICASRFVEGLLWNAVDDAADDLVFDLHTDACSDEEDQLVSASVEPTIAESDEEDEEEEECCAWATAAALSQEAVQRAAGLSCPCPSESGGSMTVNVGSALEFSRDQADVLGDSADEGFEEVESNCSDNAYEEEDAAMRVVKTAMALGMAQDLDEEFDGDEDDQEPCAEPEVEDDEADLQDDGFETAGEFAFAYVSGLLDHGISAASAPALPTATALAPCTRPAATRQLRPRERESPVPAEPFPMDCLPAAPLLLAAPAPKIDWTSLLAARPAEAAPTPAPEPQPETRPASRTKHRNIACVAKAPAPDLKTSSWQVPASPAGRGALPAAFRLDGRETPRESSLARSYDALGTVAFHRLDAEDSSRFPPVAGFAPWGTKVPLLLDSAMGRPKSGASARGPQASAMAEDLGIEAPKPRTPTRSASLTSLHVTKSPQSTEGMYQSMMGSKSGALLPVIMSKSSSAGSIAWSMRRARSAAKREVLTSVF